MTHTATTPAAPDTGRPRPPVRSARQWAATWNQAGGKVRTRLFATPLGARRFAARLTDHGLRAAVWSRAFATGSAWHIDEDPLANYRTNQQ